MDRHLGLTPADLRSFTRCDRTRGSAIVVLILAASCTAEELPTSSGARPSFDYLDCTLTATQCATIDTAIAHLEGHGTLQCRQMGSLARMRFDASGYGFRSGDPSINFHMYTIMQPDPAYPSGMGPTDNNTYVNGGTFSTPVNEIGALIAHEERHQRGEDDINHNTGIGPATQAACN